MRPLLDDNEDNASEITRDYQLELDTEGAPLLNVFGGKLTTYRRLGRRGGRTSWPRRCRTRSGAWTGRAGKPLPGGERTRYRRAATRTAARATHGCRNKMAWRLVHNYGTRSTQRARHGNVAGRSWASTSAPTCTRPKWTTCASTNGRWPPRTSSGAAASSACASTPPASHGSRPIWPRHRQLKRTAAPERRQHAATAKPLPIEPITEGIAPLRHACLAATSSTSGGGRIPSTTFPGGKGSCLAATL